LADYPSFIVVDDIDSLGVPVWSHDGIIRTGETYKSVVKMRVEDTHSRRRHPKQVQSQKLHKAE
jgi:hypothetical protein